MKLDRRLRWLILPGVLLFSLVQRWFTSGGEGATMAFVTLVGAGMLGGGLYLLRRQHRFRATAWTGTGTVTALVKPARRRSRNSHAVVPVIAFTTPTGEPFEFRSSFASGSTSYSIGQQVPILYDPMNPTHAEVNSFWPLWFAPIMLIGLGSIFAVVGAVLTIASMV